MRRMLNSKFLLAGYVLIALMGGSTAADAQSYLGVIDRSPIVEIRGETTDTLQLGADRFVQDNLDYLIANNDWLIVNFSAYWCGDSRAYRPDYDSAAAMMEFKDIRWAYADVDGTVGNENFRKRFDLPGIPVTILFHNGAIAEDKDGNRAVLDGHLGDKNIDDLLAMLKQFYKPE